MTQIDKVDLWIVILGLGLGSYAIRFVFIGLIGDRQLPAWALRHLRYTGVAVIPALAAPLVVWPAATNGEIDAPRLIAALVTIGVGLAFRNVIASVLAGGIALYLGLFLLG
ncbi:AzlD domain-containing protein [Rhodobacteraceae bacterium KMM 6894]|nr:AzlD domain-containing protein [Rhodobacteraceae bacterium KMM 6894]